jgi:acyl-CoA synthetase (AMP-forming)/AMP-acid ligase II
MKQGYDTSTITWTDGIVHHDPDAFDLERTEHGGCLAYPDRPQSVAALFDAAVDRAPDTKAFVYPEYDRTDTYAEIARRVDRLAAGLAAAGVESGDLVSMLLTNRPAFVGTYFACIRLGAVAAPINTRVSSRELSPLLDDAEPKVLLTESGLADIVADSAYEPDPESYYVVGDRRDDGRSYEALFEMEADSPRADRREHDPATVLYTSGTTGQPKGCVISSFNLVNGALNYQRSFDTDEGLRVLVNVPLFHGAGLVSNVLHALANAGTTVVYDSTGPDEFLSALETHDIEFTLTVPTTYVLAMEQADPEAYDLSSLETAAYGGAPMPEENVRRLREVFPDAALSDAYGTTETTAGLVTMCPDAYTDKYAETIGLPAPPIELAIVDGDREPLGPGEVGELAIRGPIVVDEYRNRPDATAGAFTDGWHYTGDLATIDEDGFVSLRGRSRDKIVRGGENVYVLDVEEALTSHRKVLEVSVTGFPDAILGERVLAAAVPKPGARLTEDELLDHARERLADYKIPEVIRILDELPKNPGGKVLKSELVPEPLRHGIQAGGE